ncbi:MAG: rifamycin-inactivating phosphotransferase [Caldilineales bacterium]
MPSYVLGFQEIDRTKLAVVGGKGANLGELSRIAGVRVPQGFCISVEAFRRAIRETPYVDELLDQLALLKLEDRDEVRELSSEIRRLIEGTAIPREVRDEITHSLARLGEDSAYAVRSSATAEDMPTASSAGQQDTYLNILGTEAILAHISKCWASLFSERAVFYRRQNGFDHRDVYLSVVVQKMVFPQAAGVLFTADPVTSNRNLSSIDAAFGLGEAVVAGLVNADSYKVRNGEVVACKIGAKKLAVVASRDGGTKKRVIEPALQDVQVLTDEQIVQLERIGRTIEAHFGHPQDIEWCLADDTFYIVQSRPITTLFPIPEVNDHDTHIYVSVGHQQMMTDAMRPLGISVWQLTAGRPMFAAGGRLYVDVAQDLASPARRNMLVNVLGKSDPLIKDALTTILKRGDLIQSLPDGQPEQSAGTGKKDSAPANYQTLEDYDPSVVAELIERSQASLETLKKDIRSKSGPDLLGFILADIQRLKRHISDPQSFGVIMTAMNASSWLNERMMEWLGEESVADTLSQSAPNNVTSEMGLALADVADVIRPYPEVIAYLQDVQDDNESFLDGLDQLAGGQATRDAIDAFLDRYGMRCAGEIDITRTRWSENPVILVPAILSNIRNLQPGASQRRFERGRREALEKEHELLGRLKQLPEGEHKAAETKRMIDLLRNLIGYREYPKYHIVSRYFVYKQALLTEAGQLLQAGVIHDRQDIYFLTLAELHHLVRTRTLDYQIIRQRRQAQRFYEKLTPPRIFTSDGEIIRGAYGRKDLPAKALPGLPVSSGVVEGRARVILNLADADLEDGDILVTSFTDPSWTPLFLSIKGLVTEVGGLMTHGAVIAREYGLPAVVGVENATKLIRDGQRIRVHGTAGYVEIL